MKKINLTILFSIIAFALYAQDSYTEVVRSTIKNEKKALIAEVLQLSNEEGLAFWPVYNEYQDKLYKINTDYYNTIREFADNYENMSAQTATDILIKANNFNVEEAKLEKTYIKKMLKVLSPQKTLRYFQANNKIEAMINAQLAAEIPLLENIE